MVTTLQAQPPLVSWLPLDSSAMVSLPLFNELCTAHNVLQPCDPPSVLGRLPAELVDAVLADIHYNSLHLPFGELFLKKRGSLSGHPSVIYARVPWSPIYGGTSPSRTSFATGEGPSIGYRLATRRRQTHPRTLLNAPLRGAEGEVRTDDPTTVPSVARTARRGFWRCTSQSLAPGLGRNVFSQ